MIADIEKVGKDGVVNVERARPSAWTSVHRGDAVRPQLHGPYMVTDQDRMEAVLEDPFILIHGGKISSVQDLLPCSSR